MNEQHTSIAVLEVKMDTVEKAILNLVDMAELQRKTLDNMVLTVKLLQQAQKDRSQMCVLHGKQLSELIENKNMVRGGWWALCALAAILVGLPDLLKLLFSKLVEWLHR